MSTFSRGMVGPSPFLTFGASSSRPRTISREFPGSSGISCEVINRVPSVRGARHDSELRRERFLLDPPECPVRRSCPLAHLKEVRIRPRSIGQKHGDRR